MAEQQVGVQRELAQIIARLDAIMDRLEDLERRSDHFRALEIQVTQIASDMRTMKLIAGAMGTGLVLVGVELVLRLSSL